MKVEIKNDLLFIDGKQVPYKNTPYKRGKMNPTYGVIHFTADNNPQSTIDWFMKLGRENPSSAHLLIDRSGNVTQFGKFTEILWHAGASKWKGIVGLNSHSIGIELTNLGVTPKSSTSAFLMHKNELVNRWWQKYTEEQIIVLKHVCDALIGNYKLIDLIGHDDIAPGRKQDPGPAFPWERIKPISSNEKLEFVTTSDLNLRSGSGVNFNIITVIPKNSTVESIGSHAGDFVNVIYNGINGFVAQKYLKIK